MAYVSVTRAAFRTLLIERLGLLGSTFYRTDELNRYIQESLRFWNLATGFWKARTTITTVANQSWYALPNSITSGLRVSFQSFPLSPSSLYDLDFGRPAWQSETTASGGDVSTQPKLFAVGALNLIAIWPADAAGNSQLDVDGIAATPLLVNDASVLDIGQEEMKTLLDYCEHVALFKQGGKEAAESVALLKSFLKAAGMRSGILRASNRYRKWMGLDKHRWQKKMIPAEVETGAR